MEQLEKLKILLGITDTTKDELLGLILDEVADFIKAYCYTDAVPTKLEPLIPQIAVDVYRSKGYGSDAEPEVIKSITEGERRIDYSVNEAHDPYSRYYARFRRYRRARVPSSISG